VEPEGIGVSIEIESARMLQFVGRLECREAELGVSRENGPSAYKHKGFQEMKPRETRPGCSFRAPA
jgi:hypothetical protein